jgi:hypothetical protein
VFDLIFPRGVELPTVDQPPMCVERTYEPAHNIGHFRYLECTRLDDDGQPMGEITNWDQVLFPFDPELQARGDLADVPVTRLDDADGLRIHEIYTCDASGRPRVKISTEPSGFEREFCLAQCG